MSMNREMICSWLGLTDKVWPPDPYALLGLSAEQCNGPAIEKQVHARMAKLRGYQLLHPEEATEGMTRVAQAYIVLFERHGSRTENKPPAPPVTASPPPAAATPPAPASQVYSDKAPPPPVAAAAAPARTLSDTAVAQKTRVDWQAAPPPVRGGPKSPLPAIPVGLPESTAAARSQAMDEMVAAAPTEEQVVRSLAEESEEASSGLVTLQMVIERADQTRQLLIAWRKAGRYLGNAKRRVTRAVDRADFSHQLEVLLEAAETYPAFVAHPGRPGYRAVALAHLEITPDVFNAMSEEPREQLARDWALAHKILLAHRRLLLAHFKSLRRRGLIGRAAHTLRISYHDHPVMWTGLAAAVGITACVLLGLTIVR
jgi:hypothetical protein